MISSGYLCTFPHSCAILPLRRTLTSPGVGTVELNQPDPRIPNGRDAEEKPYPFLVISPTLLALLLCTTSTSQHTSRLTIMNTRFLSPAFNAILLLFLIPPEICLQGDPPHLVPRSHNSSTTHFEKLNLGFEAHLLRRIIRLPSALLTTLSSGASGERRQNTTVSTTNSRVSSRLGVSMIVAASLIISSTRAFVWSNVIHHSPSSSRRHRHRCAQQHQPSALMSQTSFTTIADNSTRILSTRARTKHPCTVVPICPFIVHKYTLLSFTRHAQGLFNSLPRSVSVKVVQQDVSEADIESTNARPAF
ncbi:hypothetical protein BXZ70DRAFT_958936 [Cristinia sonorae]|uniref:Uncharacterized protein n=1 Tax=Cristinia sonorae TaxID=1940300 RepID=A0A8K0XL37_9AGAR|nr:hypothetical protein BXZ70DRAFT_958936 [Cristinia sonorae]